MIFVKHLHVSLVNVCEIVYFFWRFYKFFSYICILLHVFVDHLYVSWVIFGKLYTYNTFHMSSNIFPACLCFIFKVFACVYGWFYVLYGIRSIILCKIHNENQIQKWLTVIDTNQFGYGSVLYSMRMSMRIYMLHVSFHVTCYNF